MHNSYPFSAQRRKLLKSLGAMGMVTLASGLVLPAQVEVFSLRHFSYWPSGAIPARLQQLRYCLS